jgi:hypothetical protein
MKKRTIKEKELFNKLFDFFDDSPFVASLQYTKKGEWHTASVCFNAKRFTLRVDDYCWGSLGLPHKSNLEVLVEDIIFDENDKANFESPRYFSAFDVNKEINPNL